MGRKKKTQLNEIQEVKLSNCNDEKKINYKVIIKCKNNKQKEFLNLLKNDEKIICFGIGSAGSGKSYISLSYALDALKNKSLNYKKIVCFVPTCEAGAMSLGFLKGTLEEKIQPYLDADTYTMKKILERSGNNNAKEIIESLVKNEMIEYELVNFARGKTYDDSIILVNESENFSKEEMLLLLTRIGENTKVIVSGDLLQLDRKDIKKGDKPCGLQYAIEKLKNMDEFGMVEFTPEDIVRNPLITKIIELW